MNRADIKHLTASNEWKAFERHVRSIMASLNSIDDIDFTNPQSSAVEGRGRQLAKEKLRQILDPFISLSEEDGIKQAEIIIDTGL